jgi:glucokinase
MQQALPADLPPVLALDIGGTKLAVAVVTADGVTHGLQVAPTHRDQGPDRVLDRLFALGHRALDEAGLGPVAAVGISCGGPLDAAAGVLESPPHLPGWINVPIGTRVSEEFGAPAVLENDATAGARAEHLYGAGVGSRTMVYLTISTGIGGGAVVDGRLHHGSAGNGGEFGHVLVERNGRPCSCRRHGCIEAYASGTQIALRAQEALAAQGSGSSALSGLDQVTAADVAAAAAEGDPLAREIWDETTDLLGSAITDLVNVFEPDLVVLGGGVTRSGAMLVEPVRLAVREGAMGPAARTAKVELAALGDAVCVVGAGAVALERVRGAGA